MTFYIGQIFLMQRLICKTFNLYRPGEYLMQNFTIAQCNDRTRALRTNPDIWTCQSLVPLI